MEPSKMVVEFVFCVELDFYLLLNHKLNYGSVHIRTGAKRHRRRNHFEISILFNGGPVGYFGVERGHRQGDPISPLLFILAEEVHCRGLKRLQQENKITALQGPRGVSGAELDLGLFLLFLHGMR
ncbi:uncharacterized protein LOC122067600 [Macadamia integrifolia]|uniref:uncharacterized protein LOC122067600 n=1 Tax=Macadamia integrifolia TaxID=60698 RepID=UPI001C4ED083|nr:uncharacterized protein LOC122067600 [Macadamia integrifolia]